MMSKLALLAFTLFFSCTREQSRPMPDGAYSIPLGCKGKLEAATSSVNGSPLYLGRDGRILDQTARPTVRSIQPYDFDGDGCSEVIATEDVASGSGRDDWVIYGVGPDEHLRELWRGFGANRPEKGALSWGYIHQAPQELIHVEGSSGRMKGQRYAFANGAFDRGTPIDRDPRTFVTAFYTAELERAEGGVISRSELTRFAPFLSENLVHAFDGTITEIDKWRAKHPSVDPPCGGGGNYFDGMGEWPDSLESESEMGSTESFEIQSVDRVAPDRWSVKMRFGYARTKPPYFWPVEVLLIETKDGLRIDDVVSTAGRLTERVAKCLPEVRARG